MSQGQEKEWLNMRGQLTVMSVLPTWRRRDTGEKSVDAMFNRTGKAL